ncbi:hypothetical protein PVAP13_9NG809032 [Panicum virgatum]|uniref:Embryo surrounding factor 1 brassicaceae domain-containing protein n=1 Tax=Panicum virgatum TaxID=38727 RepID=A0A8T0NAM5_PANVG|nr:hypothetical protein PVAP13_9NG809032 [Panicum virgatum]
MASLLRDVMTMLMLTLLIGSPAECRHLEAAGGAVNSTSWLGEGKVTIIWCLPMQCKYFGPSWKDCYCCGDPYEAKNCYLTKGECRAKCPACNPICPPSPSSSR